MTQAAKIQPQGVMVCSPICDFTVSEVMLCMAPLQGAWSNAPIGFSLSGPSNACSQPIVIAAFAVALLA